MVYQSTFDAILATPGEVESDGEIAPGSGRIIRRGLNKIAVYKDDAGAVHELSAVCRHLGCIVDWNSLEKTWDCPCHGSRYDALGHVIMGPANSDLPPVDAIKSGYGRLPGSGTGIDIRV